MNQCGEVQAQMYRLMTKGRQWIWVQPRLYLQYHQWSRKAESINVTHYVVTYQGSFKLRINYYEGELMICYLQRL